MQVRYRSGGAGRVTGRAAVEVRYGVAAAGFIRRREAVALMFRATPGAAWVGADDLELLLLAAVLLD